METSAKASINVEEAFIAMSRDIKAKLDKKSVSKKENSVKLYLFIYFISKFKLYAKDNDK